MTTKVIVSCPDTSHWAVRVYVEDRVFDFGTQKFKDEWSRSDVFNLNPEEKREVYVHSSRRLTIVEVDHPS